jgi:preprotein translocase subunit YajC
MNIFELIPSVYAQQPAPQGSQGMLGMFVPMIVVFVIFYFLIIRPQRKREGDHQKFLSSLQKGDEVVTQSVTLELAQNVKVKVLKQTILQKVDASMSSPANS